MKGTALWILGFLAFLAGLNAVNALVLWSQWGPDGIFEPYLINNIIGGFPIATYLWISILGAFVFLGLTFSNLVGKMPDPRILANLMKKVDSLQADKDALEKMKTRLMIIDAGLSDIKKGFVDGFGKQSEDMKNIRGELFSEFDKKMVDFKQGMTKQLRKMEKTVQKAEQSNRKNATTIKKQMLEIADIKSKMERLEEDLARPKPRLTSQSELKKVKGIGKRLENDLKGIGIASVGELIMTDPHVVAEKTSTSPKTVEKLQGRAQLLMVPGIKERDVTLLEELGVTTRRELADQDPIELGKKMNGVLKVHVEKGKISQAEKPTVEDIDSWIRSAKY